MLKKTLIAIPAYNEESNIKNIVLECKKLSKVIVVNDGSDDQTETFAKRCGAKVINHKNRLGYENSIYTAVKYFVKSKYTKIIFLDADGDHPSSFIKTFDKDLNQFDIVCGIRQKVNRFGEKFFIFLSKLIWNLNDPLCGMKGYKRSFLEKTFKEKKFNSIHTFFLINGKKKKFKVKEIDINNKPRIIDSKFGSGLSTNFNIILTFFKCLIFIR